ncbi:MAG: hypothetical protein A2Z45_09305 [Chloroflexi bacterium RBG_19FT_COMBO_55_16]|nr:MAG: hypothetical protein A2Z45_09305 [Chloroflexi bacterium RBG_19FT_COMBO_55_16]
MAKLLLSTIITGLHSPIAGEFPGKLVNLLIPPGFDFFYLCKAGCPTNPNYQDYCLELDD